MPDPNELLSTAKAAEIADVGIGTIWQWIVDGQLPYIRPGHAYLVTRRDLDAYLATPRKRPGQYDRSHLKKRGEP